MRSNFTQPTRKTSSFAFGRMIGLVLITGLMFVAGKGEAQTNVTLPTGSFIVNMGINAQTKPTGLKPYGLVYDLIKNYSVPVYWVINQSKVKDGVDFTYNGVAYRGGSFIIDKKYITTAVANAITQWTSSTVVNGKGLVTGAYTTSAFTVNVTYRFTAVPTWTLDAQNGKLAQPYFANAGIPTTAYNWLAPANLGGCNDIFVMPHADPTWATHGNLYSWNLNSKGAIWLGCHAGSALANMYNPNDITQQTNFLMSKRPNTGAPGDPVAGSTSYAENSLVLWGNHSGGSIPYNTNSGTVPNGTLAGPSDPVSQFIGIPDLAMLNGSEQIFLPVLGQGWLPSTKVITYDPTQSDVPLKSPGTAVLIAYGRGFGDPSRGLVMYEAAHSLDKGTAGDIPAQRAFFNWSYLAMLDKIPVINSVTGIPTNGLINSALTYNFTVNTTFQVPSVNAKYTWSCKRADNGADFGTFNPNGTTSASSTTYTPPAGVSSNVPCVITVKITDDCGREAFENNPVTVYPGPRPPVASPDIASISTSCYTEGQSITISPLTNDSDPDGDALTITNVTGTNGTWTKTATTVTYTPPANFFGTASATYTITDGTFTTSSTITVGVGTPDANGCYPGSVRDVASTLGSGSQLNVSVVNADNALGDPDYDPADATSYAVMNASGDSLKLDFGAVYLPADYDSVVLYFASANTSSSAANVLYSTNGSSWITLGSISTSINDPSSEKHFKIPSGGIRYILITGQSGSDLWVDAAVMEHFACVPATVLANNDAISAYEDVPISFDATTNDINPGGLPLTVTITQSPANGKVSLNPDNTFTYVNNLDYSGTDVFKYRICNTQGLCSEGTVNISILDDNCGPNTYKALASGSPVTITLFPSNDTYLRENSGDSTKNYGASSELRIKGKLDRTRERTLLKFDLPAAIKGTNAQITKADLNLYLKANAGKEDVAVYRVTQPWVEGSGTGNTGGPGPSWRRRINSTPAFWTNPGGDFDATKYASTNVGSTTNVYKVWDIKSLIQLYSGGMPDSGMILMRDPESITGTFKEMKFASKEDGGAATTKDPFLTITYIPLVNTCVTVPNRAPLANPDYATTNSVTPISIAVKANDADVDIPAQTLTISNAQVSITAGAGTAMIDPANANNILYTPSATFNGTAIIRYQISDGSLTDEAFIYVTVSNSAPVAIRDNATTNSGTAVVINTAVNDYDPEGKTLAAPVITQDPKNGSAIFSGSTLTYTPVPGFYGKDTLIYQLCEAADPNACTPTVLCDTALVVITVNNQPPTATNKTLTTTVCEAVHFNLVSNISDPEGETLTITILSGTTVGNVTTLPNGKLTREADGSYTYMPNNGFTGTETIQYKVTDPGNLEASATITINVSSLPTNHAPVAVDDNTTNDPDETIGTVNQDLYIGVLDNDTDQDGNDLTLSISDLSLLKPAHGTISIVNNQIKYTPNVNYVGTDQFEYKVCDVFPTPAPGCPTPTSLCDVGLVSVNITAGSSGQPILISGTVWDDANGSANGTFSNIFSTGELGTNAGGTYVYLVNSSGTVIDKAIVNSDGTYLLSNVPQNTTGLTLLLTTSNVSIGSPAPASTLPSGWTTTSPLVTSPFSTTVFYVFGQDFGIERYPNGADYTAPLQVDPGGFIQVPVPAAAFTGTDPEDGTYVNNLLGRKVDLYPASNGFLYYNGTLVSSITSIPNFDPSKVTLDPTGSGMYSATFSYAVYDNAGKADPLPNTITMPFSGISVIATVTPVSCYNGSNGKITITNVSGGTPTSYSWTGPNGYIASGPQIDGLKAGVYTVFITLTNNGSGIGTYSEQFTVGQPSSPLVVTAILASPIPCYGGTASVSVSATGGTGSYTGTGTFSGIGAGQHIFTVTDANGCTSADTLDITQPDNIILSETHVNVLCKGEHTGSIDLTVSTGSTPLINIFTDPLSKNGPNAETGYYTINGYTYKWTGPNGYTETSEDISGLAAGTYTVVVTNTSTGCTATLTVTITEPETAISGSVTAGILNCDEGTTTLTVTASGGTGQLQYSIDAHSFQTSNIFTVGAGTYTVIVKDANGCLYTIPAYTVGNACYTLVKSVTETSYAHVGDVLHYSILVTNTGNVTLTNIVVSDPNAVITGGSPIPTLAPGASATVTATHTITQADLDAAHVTNKAVATAKDPNNNDVPGTSNEVTVNATQTPAWTLTKEATPIAYNAAGQVITYTLTLKNTGNVSISSVAITDPGADASSILYKSGDLTNVGILDVGETWIYEAKHTITQSDLNAGSYINTAKATGTPAGGTLTPATATATVTATQTNNCPVLTHNPFTNFNNTPTPQSATSLWLNVHTQLTGQLVNNGDFLLFNSGSITLNNISFTSPNYNTNTPGPVPDGKIVADATVTTPVTTFDLASNTWVTRVPLKYTSSDIFITGAIINSSNGFVRGTNYNTVLKGSFTSSVANFSSAWFYGLATYRPTFTYADVAGANGVSPIKGTYNAGTPVAILSTRKLVAGGSGGGGSNYTGSNSSTDAYVSCTVYPPKITCPGPITVNAGTECSTGVTGLSATITPGDYAIATISWNMAGATIGSGQGNIPEPYTFNVGTTTVTYTVQDIKGLTATCQFIVKVTETYPPVITCPADTLLPCKGSLDPSKTGKATAIDKCGSVTITYSDVTTAIINNGITVGDKTLRTWTAKDAAGNTSTCVQTITRTGCNSIFPTNTTCADYSTGSISSFTQLCYKPSGKTITTVTPGVFFYYTTITAPSTSFCVDVVQSNNMKLPLFAIQQDQMILYSGSCVRVGSGTEPTTGTARFCITNATVGATYTLSVKYDAKTLENAIFSTTTAPTALYSFVCKIGKNTVSSTAGSVTLAPNCTVTYTRSNDPAITTITTPSQTTINAYPNPFGSMLNFDIVPAETGKATLEVFDLLGRKLAVVYQGNVTANQKLSVKYKVPSAGRMAMIYRLTTAKGVLHGKLIPGDADY